GRRLLCDHRGAQLDHVHRLCGGDDPAFGGCPGHSAGRPAPGKRDPPAWLRHLRRPQAHAVDDDRCARNARLFRSDPAGLLPFEERLLQRAPDLPGVAEDHALRGRLGQQVRHRQSALQAELGLELGVRRSEPSFLLRAMFEPYFGFSAAPFQLSPDPSFFYGSRGHKRAHAYLQYGLYQSEGFIVPTGEVGAGKTTLIRSLLRELDSSKVVATQLVSTQLDADSLLRAVATAFGIAVRDKDKAAVLAQLEAYLLGLVQEDRKALLIVDEAQNLAPAAVEELRMLSNFQVGNRA